jgi:hypothetical protein
MPFEGRPPEMVKQVAYQPQLDAHTGWKGQDPGKDFAGQLTFELYRRIIYTSFSDSD